MADSREVMNIRQASQYLGVSPDTLYKYVNEQKIPAFKLGNRWRFKKSKLDQWMEEKSNQMEVRTKRKQQTKAAVKAAGAHKKTEGATPSGQPARRRRYQRRAHVWIRVEDDCWSGCGLLQHQGSRIEAEGARRRGGASRPGAAGAGYRGRFHDRGLGHGVERDLEAVHRS